MHERSDPSSASVTLCVYFFRAALLLPLTCILTREISARYGSINGSAATAIHYMLTST